MALFWEKINRLQNYLCHPAVAFRYFLVCFLIGVGIASFIFLSFDWLLNGGIVLLIFILFFWQKKFWRFCLIGGLVMLAGIGRYQLTAPLDNPSSVIFYHNHQVMLQGIISQEPDPKSNHINLTLAVNAVDGKKVSGNVLLNVPLYPQYRYGDEIRATCQLQIPEIINGFDYRRYLAKADISVLCSYPAIEPVTHHRADPLYESILIFKQRLITNITASLPEPQASLFAAIILGARQGLPQDLLDKFNITGTTHLIAISGMNITIIVGLFMKLAQFFGIPKKITFWFMTAALVFYIAIIGFPASAIRAAIMGWLILIALYVGRLSRLSNAVLFAAAAMVIINPRILRDDVGFQLSFLAVIGLIYFLPLLEQATANVKSWFGIKESVLITLSAQLATLPLLIYNFGRLSLIAPIANIVVVPTLPFLTVYGFIVILLNGFIPAPAFLYWPIWLVTSFIIKSVEWFSIVPFAALTI